MKTAIFASRRSPRSAAGFSRADALAMMATGSLLSLCVMPLVLRAGTIQQVASCVDHLRALGRAWSLYSEDHQGRIVHNFGLVETLATVNDRTFRTWAHNVLDWTVNPSNTNASHLQAGTLYAYTDNNAAAFKCPADTFLAAGQSRAGWARRVRSYSLNGFMGLASTLKSDLTQRGENLRAPGYRQFLLSSSIPNPSHTLTFIDEHPDSINDGMFINPPPVTTQWTDLPGSHHEGGGGVAFADGSAEIHVWAEPSTRYPVRFNSIPRASIPANQRHDYTWLVDRMTVPASTLSIRQIPDGRFRIVWSAFPTNRVLQSARGVSGGEWTDLPEAPVRELGQSAMTLEGAEDSRWFRLSAP